MFTFPVGFYQQPATGVDYAARWRSNAIAGGGTVSTGTYNATRTLVSTLQTTGTLAKLNLLWHFSGNYAASPYLLKYPTGHPGSVTYNGFSSSQYSETTGLSSTGAEYADLNYTPSTYQTSNTEGSLIVYCHTSAASDFAMGVLSPEGNAMNILTRRSDNMAIFDCYNASSDRIITGSSDGHGLFIGNRTSSTYSELRQDDTILATNTGSVVGGLPTMSMIAFGINYNYAGTVNQFKGTMRLSLCAVGLGLTSTDTATIKSAYATYAAAIGRSLP